MIKIKLYIAGFDVFFENSAELGNEMKKICSDFGFKGLYPLDNNYDTSKDIFNSNLSMIDESDAVIANLNSFRGNCMDDGTAFEIGYAFAKQKIIYGYISDKRTLRERMGEKDCSGFYVENFGFPVNLMIAESLKIINGTFYDCVKAFHNSIFKGE